MFDKKREAFASKLATKHYRRTVAGRAWVAWHGVVEAKWRQRVEKSCQVRHILTGALVLKLNIHKVVLLLHLYLLNIQRYYHGHRLEHKKFVWR